jgi:gustatory receptor
MSYSHIFTLLDYDVIKGIVLQLINLQLTFIWTYNDLFVMLISTALASRFSQITARIQSVADAKVDQITPETTIYNSLQIDTEIIWKNLREDYNRLCRLCRRVDEVISYIVLLTFASDLFFILVQLFNSLKQMRNDLERLYFYWSFGLLILRTVCLCLFGAKVNDESTKPILILNSVPSNVYNLEVKS